MRLNPDVGIYAKTRGYPC